MTTSTAVRHYYAVSGYENAETLHIFASAKDRDRFTEEADKDHYTMDNLHSATAEEAKKYCGYSQAQWNEKIAQWDYIQKHE